MTVTKKDLADLIFKQAGIKKKDSFQIIESVFEIMKDELATGRPVTISGFGKWDVKDKNARLGRNPYTGEALTIPGRRVVTFRCSPILRKETAPDGGPVDGSDGNGLV